jgi:hypothetical protein
MGTVINSLIKITETVFNSLIQITGTVTNNLVQNHWNSNQQPGLK